VSTQMSSNIVVVHGATGHLGRYVVDELLARGHPKANIVTPVRKPDEESAKGLKALGVKVVKGDLHDQPSLEAAYQGAHSIVFIPITGSAIDRVKATEYSLAAARSAKVKRFIAVSAGNGKVDSANILQSSYVHLEAAVRSAGVPWLIVKMGLYAENYDRDYKAAATTGVLTFPTKPYSRLALITRRDIATGIAAAVLKWDLVEREFTLSGPTAPSFEELAAAIGKITGKKVLFKEVTVPEYQKFLEPTLGPWAPLVSAINHGFGQGGLNNEFPVTNDLYELTGRTADQIETHLATVVSSK